VFFTILPGAFTQVPPAGVLVGPTPMASLRNAAAATRDQASMTRQAANAWMRNANSVNYRIDLFQSDLHTMQLQLLVLRERFDWMAYLALQLNRPNAANALAELDAGLNLIGELPLFLDEQFRAGVLDRPTLVRTCRAFENAMREWELELRKSNSRLGVIW
jgi:hypothetical protein